MLEHYDTNYKLQIIYHFLQNEDLQWFGRYWCICIQIVNRFQNNLFDNQCSLPRWKQLSANDI